MNSLDLELLLDIYGHFSISCPHLTPNSSLIFYSSVISLALSSYLLNPTSAVSSDCWTWSLIFQKWTIILFIYIICYLISFSIIPFIFYSYLFLFHTSVLSLISLKSLSDFCIIFSFSFFFFNCTWWLFLMALDFFTCFVSL